MSVSDESEPVQRKISLSEKYEDSSVNYVDIDFEIDKCIEWINQNDFSRIALQFPDSLLKSAPSVAIKIEEKTEKKFFILRDISFGRSSCCVDEAAAEHVSADAIIHFGHACLTPTLRYPVLYIFGRSSLDVQNLTDEFRKLFSDETSHVIIYYEVFYSHVIDQIAENLDNYENLVVPELEIPHEECSTFVNDNHVKITKCQRHFIIPKSKNLEDYSIFYIGSRCQTLTNLMMSFIKSKFYTYDPIKKVARPETLDVNQFLRKRYYYIQKAKDAKIIGILVATLGVADHLDIVKHLRDLIQAAGKKVYTLLLGDVAKFAEIDVLVSVACMESCAIDCSGFYRPIITPYELEIALNPARKWTGDFVTDFRELLPGAAMHVKPSDAKEGKVDISLITGKLRTFELLNPFSEDSNSSSEVEEEGDSLTISTLHSQVAGEHLSECSWKGLEQCVGETPVTDIEEGRKGIACQYDNEEQ